MTNRMVTNFKGSSEEATLNKKEGVETEPLLRKIAASHGIKVTKLLKSDLTKLSDEEIDQVMRFTSCVLPKELERRMIDKYRSNRQYLNELLFNHNARAATSIATRYYYRYVNTVINPVYEREEFLSAARYGLWQGALRFDLDRTWNGQPVKFLTFATPWMFRYVMELFAKKENMVETYSLDAPRFGGDADDAVLGDFIAAEENEGDVTSETDESVADVEEESASVQNVADYDNDIDNSDFEQLDKDETTSILDKDGGVEHELLNEPQDAELVDQRTSERYMDALKKLTKLKTEYNEQDALEAIDDLCRTICKIKNPEERAITLFVGRRFINAAVAKLKDRCSSVVRNAKEMLKGVPTNRAILLQSLQLDEIKFKKLCNHYAANYTRKYEGVCP